MDADIVPYVHDRDLSVRQCDQVWVQAALLMTPAAWPVGWFLTRSHACAGTGDEDGVWEAASLQLHDSPVSTSFADLFKQVGLVSASCAFTANLAGFQPVAVVLVLTHRSLLCGEGQLHCQHLAAYNAHLLLTHSRQLRSLSIAPWVCSLGLRRQATPQQMCKEHG